MLLSVPAVAWADPPESWEDGPAVSPLYTLLVLVGIPLLLFVLIALAVYVPSMSRGGSYQPGQAWRAEPEWFGGPSDGLEAADRTAPPAVSAGSGKGPATGSTSLSEHPGAGAGGHVDPDEPRRGGGSGRW